MMRYLVVDDEPLARQIIVAYAEQIPFLSFAGQCDNAFSAIEILGKEQVDLLFLDIELPNLNGFDMLRSLRSPPNVIVVTAHKDYALEGFELDVLDFLLKPYSFERFLRAVQKAIASLALSQDSDTLAAIFVKDGKRMHQVKLADLWWVESAGNYCLLHTEKGNILCQDTLTQIEHMLPSDAFMRIHKSHIVALAGIEWVETQVVAIRGSEVPVGRTFRKQLEQKIQQGRGSSSAQ